MDIKKYFAPLEGAFRENAIPEKAAQMKKYMKGLFEYHGIQTPVRLEILRDFINDNGLPPPDYLEAVTNYLWEKPEREYQYVAMNMLDRQKKKVSKDFISLYEDILLKKSWWDSVDYIAAALVGHHFKKFPEQRLPYTEKWMASGNMWLQRSALLFQLKYKKDTDTDLLTKYIRELSGSKEFFIRKAIGWTLREYSKTDPRFVIHFTQNEEISNFSKKEALKWISKHPIE